MIKYLAQFNITLSFLIIWMNRSYSDGIIVAIIFLIIIWYNWSTILLIKGQSIAKRRDYVIGIINIILGILIFYASIINIYIELLENPNKAVLIFIIPQTVLSVSIMGFSFKTLKMHKKE
jgi:hypothetical protein